MSSKKFGSGIESILKSSKSGISSKQKENTKTEKSSTIIVLEKNLFEKVKSIAYWHRTTLKHVLEDILTEYFNSYDKEKLKTALMAFMSATENLKLPTSPRSTKKVDSETVRINVVIEKSLFEKAKSIAYWERITLKIFFESVLNNYFSQMNHDELHISIQEYRNSLQTDVMKKCI